MVMANRIKLTPEKKNVFLSILRECGNVSHAAMNIGMARGYMYEVRAGDPDFAAAWDEAVESSLDDIEQALRKRAVEGVDRPVFYQGEVCGHVKEFSDTAAIFLLKGRRPDVFRDRSESSVTVKSVAEELTERLEIARNKVQQYRNS